MQENYLILGLARSGISALRYLVKQGKTVYVSDDNPERIAEACAEGGIVWTDEHKFENLTALIQSPGIPLTHPIAIAAHQHGVNIIGDIDLFRQAYPSARIVGITGTNGKSTTATLIGHILNECGVPVAVGGNVGIPAMSLPELSDKGVYVLELSSYQLDLSKCLGVTIAAWTNITPDHLERHKTMEDYIYAKSKIFAGKTTPPLSVMATDDKYSRDVFDRMNAAHPGYFTQVSVIGPLSQGIFVFDGMLIDSTGNDRINLGDISRLEHLKGIHNYQNIAIAYTVCKKLGVEPRDIMAAIQTFTGLAHRQEYVATIQDVTFVNDSKATNAVSAAQALKTYEKIYWIVGGLAKSDGINSLLPLLSNVKKAYLIGEAADDFAITLSGMIPYEVCGDIITAVQKAYTDAKLDTKSTVLLAPACASFDQFKDFEHRGDVFKEIVKQIKD